MKEKLLKLLMEYDSCIENAKNGFHNVNQWDEDIGNETTYNGEIDKAYNALKNAIEELCN